MAIVAPHWGLPLSALALCPPASHLDPSFSVLSSLPPSRLGTAVWDVVFPWPFLLPVSSIPPWLIPPCFRAQNEIQLFNRLLGIYNRQNPGPGAVKPPHGPHPIMDPPWSFPSSQFVKSLWWLSLNAWVCQDLVHRDLAQALLLEQNRMPAV